MLRTTKPIIRSLSLRANLRGEPLVADVSRCALASSSSRFARGRPIYAKDPVTDERTDQAGQTTSTSVSSSSKLQPYGVVLTAFHTSPATLKSINPADLPSLAFQSVTFLSTLLKNRPLLPYRISEQKTHASPPPSLQDRLHESTPLSEVSRSLTGPDQWRELAICVAGAVAFGAGVWALRGEAAGQEFFAGYLLEQSLSIDNLFVFILVFSYFKTPPVLQKRVSSALTT